MISIRLFGVPSIAQGEVPFAFAAPKRAFALLAYLATRPGEAVARQRLGSLLWPDVPESDGRANLRRHAHLLSRALPPAEREPWLIATPAALAWNARAPAWVDVLAFEQAIGAGTDLEWAAALASAEFMLGFDDDWIAERRLRLRQLHFDNLDRLLERAVGERDVPLAIAYAQEMLRCDPWREDAVRHLIRLRRQAGDRAGALVEYERFAARLRDEIDVDPMPETVAEYESLLHDAPPRAAPSAAEPTGARVRFELPFVGRQLELEALETALSRAARGYGRLVLVGGEAGTGKTRLLGELGAFAAREGVLELQRATSIIEASPYQVVAEAIGAALEWLDTAVVEPIWLATLATIVPDIARRYPALPPLPELDPERERRRLFEAISVVLTRLAATRPLLVALEDLHWAGPATVALLEDLAHAVAGRPILIVGTYREEELERGHPLRHVRRRLLREGLVDRVAVGLLTQREVEAALVPFVPAPARGEVARELYARSDGNAFFLSELVRDRAERAAAGGPPADDGPPALHETIAARLGRLSEDARAVAAIGAVIGRAFDVELVRAIGGWRERDLLDGLDELVEHGIVRELGAAGSDYAFAHHLMQAAIYERTPPAQRQRRHRRVALALEELHPERADELAIEIAHHFEAGGEPERAGGYFARAAATALALQAHDDAVAFATRGLALAAEPAPRRRLLFLREEANERRGERAAQRADLDALGAGAAELDPDERFELARRRCALAHAAGERREQALLVQELRALAKRSGDPRHAAIVALARGSYLYHERNRYDEANAVLSDGFALAAPVVPDVALQCALLSVRIAAVLGEHAQAEQWLERADALVSPHSPGHALLLIARCALLLSRSDPAAIARCAAELLDVADATGDLESRAIGCYYSGLAAAWRFDVARARAVLTEAERLFAHLGDKEYVLRTLIVRGNLAAIVGDVSEALEAHREAERLAVTLGWDLMKAVAVLNIAYDAFFAGDFAEASRAAKRGVRLSSAAGAPGVQTDALLILALTERERGAFAGALASLEAALAHVRAEPVDAATLAVTLAHLAETNRRAGRLDEARRAADEMLAVFVEANEMRPQWLLWIAAQAYRDSAPPRAAAYLRAARELLQQQARAIPDARTHAAFLALPYNREILAAYDAWLAAGRFSDAVGASLSS